MAGRGRGLTLPAWMTQQNDGTLPQEQNPPAVSAAPPASVPMQSQAPHFADAPATAPGPPTAPTQTPYQAYPPAVPQFPYPHMHPPQLSQMPPQAPPQHPPQSSQLLPQAPPQYIPYSYPPPQYAQPYPYQAPAPVAAPKPINPENDASAWSTHTNDNLTYYYNSITKTSTFDKPNCLKTPEERSMPTCAWKQYTAENGKVYYSNGKDSMWTMPVEYQEWLEKCEAIKQQKADAAAAAATATTATTTSTTKPAAKPKPAPARNLSPEEASAAFTALLQSRNVTSSMKFKEIADVCSEDADWSVIRTNGERKQLISEYQNRKLKAEREENKLQQKKHRAAYMTLLASCPDIDSNSSYEVISNSVCNDARYKQLDESERREYFYDFISELQKKEKLEVMEKKNIAISAFKTRVVAVIEEQSIPSTAIYADVKDKFREFAPSILDEYDMRHVYQDIMHEIEAKERQAAKDAENALLAKREQLIVDMKAYLEELIIAETLTLDSHWRDIEPLCKQQTWYEDLLATYTARGGTANKLRDIYDDVYYTFRDEFKQVMRNVKDAVYDAEFNINPETSFDVFSSFLTPLAENYRLDMKSKVLKLVFSELHEDAVFDHKEKLRQIAKYKTRFIELLEDYYYLSDHVNVSWEEARDELCERSAYKRLDKELRKAYFDEYMAELRDKLAVKQRNVATMLQDIEAGEVVDTNGATPAVATAAATAAAAPSIPVKRSLDYESESSCSSRGRKHSKKHKDKKKHKKHKKSRSHSRRSRS